MEPDYTQLASLFPGIAAQLRGALSNLHLAADQLVPRKSREEDPAMDAKAAVLDQSYYQMLRLVTNLSAAEHLVNDEPLPLQDTDVAQLVGDLCEQCCDLAQLREIHLSWACAADRLICAVHPASLELLLYHLLSNALKFTPAGGTVAVDLKVSGQQLLLSVADTGCGIPAERLPTLFDRYLYTSGAMDPPPHGLGLGLPLCRAIARRHGGTLMAESIEGKGSRFTASIPLRQLGTHVSAPRSDYSGGFNRSLLGLSDALPVRAFLVRSQD